MGHCKSKVILPRPGTSQRFFVLGVGAIALSIYVLPYIERAMELKLNEIALNRSRNHSEDK